MTIHAEELGTARADRLPAEQVVGALGSDAAIGLRGQEARARLADTGRNELPAPPGTPPWKRALRQLRDPMALLLLAAAAVSGLVLGEIVEAVAIAAIVCLNAVIALVEEGRAASALAALRGLEVARARVRRDGADRVVDAAELVPGDLVLLEAGDRVPADLRLLEVHGLEVDESMLTGESLAVAKDPGRLAAADAALGERAALAFSGTFIARGAARGVVVATGPRTVLGAIARGVTVEPRPTPLQVDLNHVTARLGAVALAVAAVVLVLTLARTGLDRASAQEAFLASVALAVAAVPEGLATVTSVALALGVRRMAERGAIVRRLSAVETLGSASVLAVDKTGTLTENRMAFEAVAPPDGDFGPLDRLDPGPREWVERVAALCNDAALKPPVGDPTELALLEGVGAQRVGALRADWPRVALVPFDAERKRMTTVNRGPDGSVELLAKGAPEAILPRCAWMMASSGRRLPLGRAEAQAVAERAAKAAGRGMRVLALARRPLEAVSADLDGATADLELVALAGLRDPIRPAAQASVALTRAAGITLLMATGDHPATASAVAEEVSLAPAPVRVTTGRNLRADGLPDDPATIRVYARVDPDQKLDLVAALQHRGHVVAMTGDGVNDAPALRRADIGIALGARGSDVAREAADMVVTDDDLGTIVTAVREGRGVYDNVRKVVDYLVAGNLGEVLVVVCGLLFIPGLGVPLLPVQLLWINLLTDGMPAVALGVDPVDPALMRRPPRPRRARLLAWNRLWVLLGRGAVIAAATLGALLAARGWLDTPWDHARTVMFTTLVVAHLLYAFVVRRGSGGVLANRWLVLAVTGGFAAQLLIVIWPGAHEVFSTVALTAREWLVVAVAGIVPALLLGLLPGPPVAASTRAPAVAER